MFQWSHGASAQRRFQLFYDPFSKQLWWLRHIQVVTVVYLLTLLTGAQALNIKKKVHICSRLTRGQEKSVFHNSIQELCSEDYQGFHDFLQMSKNRLQESQHLVIPFIRKMNTKIPSLSLKRKWCSSCPKEYSQRQLAKLLKYSASCKQWCHYDYIKTKLVEITIPKYM